MIKKWRSNSLLSGLILFGVLLIPFIRQFLESVMVLHMLVQLPLLVLVGWLIGITITRNFQSHFDSWNSNGIPGTLLFVMITMYWMIPRTLDEALSIWYIELFKYVSLPVIGLLLYDSWKKLQSIGKSFIYLNYLSMFGLMAWLYIDSPIQICNNYLAAEQKILGWGLLGITAFMVLYLVQAVFTDQTEEAI
ncbi:hypothetical protein GMD78_11950 [Ornithinibacillus sp. L9]|uniref:Uncharacterized protein n=1 Tax=Ornithinibacillus caprae TaxID=2678566 RepID=A0A6N8FM62_9BACI|nr:hypothetical protein [Ornithinibacillus caprae]MUK89087.1 hypothetical protein [Ornithinibacillus caprae]